MNIRQISVAYMPREDRILVRVNTDSHDEVGFWLTRRLCLGLWPALKSQIEKTGSSDAARTALHDGGARAMMAEFRRERSLRQSDFATPFTSGRPLVPLGAAPLLATDLGLSPGANGHLRIDVKEGGSGPQASQAGRAFCLNLSETLMHGLQHLLRQALAQSGWHPWPPELALDLDADPAGDASAARTVTPRYVN